MGSSKGRFLLEGKNKHSIRREREREEREEVLSKTQALVRVLGRMKLMCLGLCQN